MLFLDYLYHHPLKIFKERNIVLEIGIDLFHIDLYINVSEKISELNHFRHLLNILFVFKIAIIKQYHKNFSICFRAFQAMRGNNVISQIDAAFGRNLKSSANRILNGLIGKKFLPGNLPMIF